MQRMLENVALLFSRDDGYPPCLHPSSRTILGQMHRVDGIPNQGAYFAQRISDTLAVAVFDGHGDAGHFASSLASEQMVAALAQFLGPKGDELDGPVTMAFARSTPDLAKIAAHLPARL